MQADAIEKLGHWPYRGIAIASVAYVADYYDLELPPNDVIKVCIGLMAAHYDERMLLRAKRAILSDEDFAKRLRYEDEPTLWASDFEIALQNRVKKQFG